MRFLPRIAAAAGLLAVAAVAHAPSAIASTSPAVPFHDRNVNGTITFCDKNNRPVTSGSINAAPFVWKAVSSVSAPPAWQGPYGKADLVLFQPRKDVDPGLWSGRQFTTSAHYSNPKVPMTQATKLDPSLANFTAVAPLWDGLVQVRMFFTNVNTQPHISPYPATVVKVTGSHWQVVSAPGTGSCTAGTAVSTASKLIPTIVGSASPSPKPSSSATTGTSTASPGASTSSGAATSPTDATTDPAFIAASSTSSGGSSAAPWIAALILLPIAAVIAGVAFARRSRVKPKHVA